MSHPLHASITSGGQVLAALLVDEIIARASAEKARRMRERHARIARVVVWTACVSGIVYIVLSFR